MKKTILFLYAVAATVAVAVVGCNNGYDGESEGLDAFLGSFAGKCDTCGTVVPPVEGEYKVTVVNGAILGSRSNYKAGEEVAIKTDKDLNGQKFREWATEDVDIAYPNDVITSFIMPARAVTVTAIFGTLPKYTVIYDGNGGAGSPPIDPLSPYDSGVTVTVLSDAIGNNLHNDGYYFSGWYTQKDGKEIQLAEGNTFTITDSMTLFAKWTADSVTSYDVTVLNGSSGSGMHIPGNTVTITAGNKNEQGETFDYWEVLSPKDVTIDKPYALTATFIMPHEPVQVRANFKPTATYRVFVSSVGINATRDSSYAAGDQVTIYSGEAPDGQQFKGWTVDFGEVSLRNPNSQTITFDMPANEVKVTANFETKQTQTFYYKLEIDVDGKGKVILDPPMPDGGYREGTQVKATAKADDGFKFSVWTGTAVNGNVTTESVTFKMDKELTLTAHFKEDKGSTATAHDAPKNVTATVSQTEQSIIVKWDPVPGAEEYYVSRNSTGTTEGYKFDISIPIKGGSTSYTDKDVESDKTYYYWITASVGGEWSDFSNRATAYTLKW